MLERQPPSAIEHEVAAHLRHIDLFRVPDLARQGKAHVFPHDMRRCDGHETTASEAEMSITLPFGVGKPQKGMTEVLGETFEVFGMSKGDHCDLSERLSDLLVEPPQLREMLLTIESTEVAKQNQNCWASK